MKERIIEFERGRSLNDDTVFVGKRKAVYMYYYLKHALRFSLKPGQTKRFRIMEVK